jgi:hypothetical protein
MKIEFKQLENGGLKCKNTGFEMHFYFAKGDNVNGTNEAESDLYFITNDKGEDIALEYLSFEEGIQAIKDYIND